MRAPGLRHHDRTCTRERAGQIGLVQHRHHRAPGGGDGFAVLGLDYLDGDVDDQVDVRVGGACLRCHRHARRAPSTLQGARHRAATHPGTPTDRYAQRFGGPLRDRHYPLVGGAGGESRQLVDENLVPLSAHLPPDRFVQNGGTLAAEARVSSCPLPAEGNC